jgi:hypothetical protein
LGGDNISASFILVAAAGIITLVVRAGAGRTWLGKLKNS